MIVIVCSDTEGCSSHKITVQKSDMAQARFFSKPSQVSEAFPVLCHFKGK